MGRGSNDGYAPPVAYEESFRGGPKFRHNRVTSQTSIAFAKTAWFCFTFLGSEGNHGTVVYPLGTLVCSHIGILQIFKMEDELYFYFLKHSPTI